MSELSDNPTDIRFEPGHLLTLFEIAKAGVSAEIAAAIVIVVGTDGEVGMGVMNVDREGARICLLRALHNSQHGVNVRVDQ